MNIKYVQLIKGCIALIITVSGLYIGQALWQNYAVDLPLNKALHSIDGVKKATWDNSGKINGSVNICVSLDSTADLHKAYGALREKIEETLKGRKYTLKIEDNPAPELEQAYYEIHYYIQKAILDGDFPLLEEKVREKAAAAGAESRVYVDAQNIYLQLNKGSSSLYSVIARISGGTGGNI